MSARWVFLLTQGLFLAACGGGGGSTTPSNDVISGGDGSGIGSNGNPPSPTFAVDTTARFNTPTDLAIDNAGNLYVSDEGNQIIRKISPTGEVSSLPADTLYQSELPLNRRVSNLAIDPSGNLYVLSPFYGEDIGELIRPALAVHKLAPDGTKTLIANYWTEAAWRPYIPLSITTDEQGRLFTLGERDEYSYINRRDLDGSYSPITEYGGCCAGSIEQFASDEQGNIAFVTDDFRDGILVHRFFRVSRSAQPANQMIAEIPAQTRSHGASHFDVMTYESNGDIYTADVTQDNDWAVTSMRIMKTTSDGETTVIYQGFPDGSTASRPLTSSGRKKVGMVRAANGDFYVSDPYLHAIYKITPSGQASLIAGKESEPGASD